MNKKHLLYFLLFLLHIYIGFFLYSFVFSPSQETVTPDPRKTDIDLPSIVTPSVLNQAFSSEQIQSALKRQQELSEKYKITALLLHWKRTDGVKTVLQKMLQSNKFVEVIVWNNNPDVSLSVNDLGTTSDMVRIINSKENLRDKAKYKACEAANTPVCFYADDDWNISKYLNSLIADFVLEPRVLHAVTDAYTYYTNLIWSYFDSSISLHTGFSWIGCGSVFLRSHAVAHLKKIETFLESNPEHRDLVGLSDVFFSIWMNQIPSQFNAFIEQLPQTHGAFSNDAGFQDKQYRSSVNAIRILDKELRANNPLFIKDVVENPFPKYVKSPSYNDEYTFYSSVIPFEEMERVPFTIQTDYERGTRRNLPSGERVNTFQQYSTAHAVDNRKDSCWKTASFIKNGDLFGIDLHSIQSKKKIRVIHSHSQQDLKVFLSLDGTVWANYASTKGISHSQSESLYDASQFEEGFQMFRLISFVAEESSLQRNFHVCEVQIE